MLPAVPMKGDDCISEILNSFKHVIGADFERYYNHAMRVYYHCIMLDQNPENAEKYALAAAFHDIGIWTNNTFDYINPSTHQTLIYLHKHGKEALTHEVSEMIYWHHKITSYTGDFDTVENFRKADWIDVSKGLLTFGCSRKLIRTYQHRYPNKGFHTFLLRKTIINTWQHPLNPLPMFRR